MGQDIPPLDPNRWVDRHGDALYRYARLRLRDPDDAAEVVQETFLEAFRARASYSGRSTERTWLIGILRHKIVDRIRRLAIRKDAAGSTEDADRSLDDFFDERGVWRVGPSPWGDDPAQLVERAEFWEVFRRCLDELPAIYGVAFTLRELEGLESEEVCRILEITPTNLWARLHRARVLLRQSLEIHWFGPGRT